MKTRSVWFVVLALCACHGKNDSKDTPAPAPAPAVKQPAEDPLFDHVDRDQLAALCLAARLPETRIPPDDAALIAADGTRTPWLTVWLESRPDDDHPTAAKDWIAAAVAHERDLMSRCDGCAQSLPPRSGPGWRNVVCDETEVFTVALSGVAFEKDASHAFAIRRGKLVEDRLPPSTPRDQVFRRAVELTEQQLGGPVKIATHSLGGSRVMSTMSPDDNPWIKAVR